MRTLDIRGALRRRWYVLLVGILGTAALAAAGFVRIGASYELRSSALLLPPSVSVVAPETRELVNPFLRLDGIDPALSVLVTKLMAEDFSEQMLADAPASDYMVAEDPTSQAPIIVVTASSKDADEASAVLDRVVQELPTVLDDLQDEAGITRSARITLVPLVRDSEPQRVLGGLLRVEILLLGAGVVGTLLLAGLWDAIARSRAARRATGDHPGGETMTATPAPAPAPASASAPAPAPAAAAAPASTTPRARPAPPARQVNGKVPRKAKKAARAASRTTSTRDDPPTTDDVGAPGIKV
jgi:hypothetical protein